MSPTRNPEFSLDGEQPAVPVSVTPVPAPAGSPRRKSTSVARQGIYIPLTPDGQLDEPRVRDKEGLEKVRAALKTDEQKKEPIQVSADLVKQGYSLLEVIIQKGGKWFLKWPDDFAAEMQFDPKKVDNCIKPTQAVIAKYSDKLTWLVANQEVAALGMAINNLVVDMVESGAKRYMAKKQAERLNTAQPPNGGEVTVTQ